MSRGRPKSVPKSRSKVEDDLLKKDTALIQKLWEVIKNSELKKCLERNEFDYSTSVLIWQYYRLNEKYVKKFRSLKTKKSKNGDLVDLFTWGLSDVIDPSIVIPKETFLIQKRRVASVDIDKVMSEKKKSANEIVKTLKKLSSKMKSGGLQTKMILLVVEDGANISELTENIRKELVKHVIISKGRSLTKFGNLSTIGLCYYLFELYNKHLLSKEEVVKIGKSMLNHISSLTFTRIKKNHEKFLRLSELGPSAFFS